MKYGHNHSNRTNSGFKWAIDNRVCVDGRAHEVEERSEIRVSHLNNAVDGAQIAMWVGAMAVCVKCERKVQGLGHAQINEQRKDAAHVGLALARARTLHRFLVVDVGAP